jgi:hypothetical protein
MPTQIAMPVGIAEAYSRIPAGSRVRSLATSRRNARVTSSTNLRREKGRTNPQVRVLPGDEAGDLTALDAE